MLSFLILQKMNSLFFSFSRPLKPRFWIDKPLKTRFGIDKPLKPRFGIDKLSLHKIKSMFC
eukprot:UN00773